MQDMLMFDVRRLNRILSNLYEEMKTLQDHDRELPMKWSTMHMYSSSQLAVLTALKRDLNPELLGIAAALHDIGAIKTKKRENHAKNGSTYVYEIINEYNTNWRGKLHPITKEELDLIHLCVVSHGEKDIESDNPYVEAMKDVDSLDRYLHGVPTKGAHIKHLLNMTTLYDFKL